MHAHRFILMALLTAGLGGLGALGDEQPARESRRAATAPDAEERNKLDLNTADIKELEAVPVIGPDLAPVIIAARPFATTQELDRLQGISAERLEQIRAQVKVTPTLAGPRDSLGFPVDPATPPAENTDSFGLPKSPQAPSAEDEPLRIDVNIADVKTLESISVIGPRLAREIIAKRPFESLDDLNRLSGISTEHLALLKARLIVVPATNEQPKKGKKR